MRSWLFVAVALLAACTDLGGLSGSGDATPDAGDGPPPTASDGGGDDGSAPLVCTGLTACGTACVDTQSDVKNCGRCGHDCLGGDCKSGVCAPVTLAKDLNDPMGIAQDENSLYVAVYGSNAIVQVAKVAGGANTLTTATTNPASIAVSLDGSGKAAYVVWGEERFGGTAKVGTCAPPCSSVQSITTNADEVMGVVALGGAAYFTTIAGNSGAINRCSLPGCTSVMTVLSSVDDAYGLTATGTTLLYGKFHPSGEVARVEVTGGGGAHLFDADMPAGIATDGTNVYAAVNGGNQIAKCALSGCIGGPTTLAFANNPHGVATDGKNVYWTNGIANGAGTVAYCAVGGCPAGAALLASQQANPYGIIVDDVAVYWVTSAPNGAVMKIAKP